LGDGSQRLSFLGYIKISFCELRVILKLLQEVGKDAD
jgi:hypothetical protein